MCANGVYKSYWEPLAELHFDLTSSEIHDETYTYCLCSRVLISNIAEEQSDDEDFPTDTRSPPKHQPNHPMIENEVCQQFEGYENFNQFWSVNSETIVWKTWFEKYSDYIDPQYDSGLRSTKIEDLKSDVFTEADDANCDHYEKQDILQNKILLDLPTIIRTPLKSPQSFNGEDSSSEKNDEVLIIEEIRERKFSYDSKTRKNYENAKKNDTLKRRSESDLTKNYKNRDLTVKNAATDGRSIDSMTNITRLSISSFLSTDFDDVKVSPKSEPAGNDDYWKGVWDEHLFETYERYYTLFINWYGQQRSTTYENGLHYDCNKKRRDSVGTLLKTLLNTTLDNMNESTDDSADLVLEDEVYDVPVDGSEESHNKNHENDQTDNQTKQNTQRVNGNSTFNSRNTSIDDSYDEDEKNPHQKRNYKVKRSHEAEFDNIKSRVKKAFHDIGLEFDKIPSCGSRMKKLRRSGSEQDEAAEEAVDSSVSSTDRDGDDSLAAELVWRRRRIKRISQPRQHKVTLKPTHLYFSDSNDDEQGMVGDMPISNEATGSNEVSSECDHPTVREASKSIQPIECKPELPPPIEPKAAKRLKRIKRKKNFQNLPPEVAADSKLKKYWRRRWSLFSLFDRGIQLDHESWYSVTPEAIAAHTASRLTTGTVVDGFCGAGGNTIQLALACNFVFACDIDSKKVALAEHNATIYGVQNKIQFIVGDFFKLAETLKADAVFLSPPWGGPKYIRSEVYDVETMLQPAPASELMSAARKISNEIAIYLPRNTDTKQLVQLAGEGNSVEIEQNYLDTRLVALTAYYGDLVYDTSEQS